MITMNFNGQGSTNGTNKRASERHRNRVRLNDVDEDGRAGGEEETDLLQFRKKHEI